MKYGKQITLPNYLAIGIIVCYFIAGLFITPDYGINWDDTDQRQNGLSNWSFVTNTDRSALILNEDRYHGPAFELLLIAVEKSFHLIDLHDIFLARHYCVFLFFCSVLIAFFLLCRKLFGSSWLGLLGLAMLLFSPRIFAESFYNPKDIVFLGGMIWALYSLLIFSESLTYRNSLFHAFTCAFAVDVRVVGILLLPITCLLLIYYIYQRKFILKSIVIKIVFFFLAFFVLMVMMWPILILNPFEQLWLALKQMSNYVIWDANNIYMGSHIPSIHTPWHYHWVWILITLPEICTILFLCGFLLFLNRILMRKFIEPQKAAFILISLFFFFFPLVTRSLTRSVVYDAWRHVFFVYPFFVILAVYAVSELSQLKKKMFYRIAIGIIIIAMTDILISLITMHPYQYVYFNHTARALFRPIDQKFEMDYWGVSYKQGLEYLMENDSNKIKVCFGNKPGSLNYLCLKPKQRDRFEVIKNHDGSVYFLTNYRDHWMPSDSIKPFHTLKAQGNVVLGIYKLR